MNQSTSKVFDLCITGMFTAVICVLAIISIPMEPVPFSLSLFAVLLTGAILKPRYAFSAVLCYLVIGAIGIPVYANMRAGVGVLFGMTGGYLMAYPGMALITSMSVKLFGKHNVISLGTGMIISLLFCYIVGTAWFIFLTGSSVTYSLSLCVYPFVVFDLIKIAFAAATTLVLLKTPVAKSIQGLV